QFWGQSIPSFSAEPPGTSRAFHGRARAWAAPMTGSGKEYRRHKFQRLPQAVFRNDAGMGRKRRNHGTSGGQNLGDLGFVLQKFDDPGFWGWGKLMLQAAKINADRVVRVGVVGVGVMGSNHARVLAEFPGVVLAGVADADRKQAHEVGSTLGCPAVSSVEELLERGVDAVSIAAPTHLHRDIALACIARGVHVMLENRIASGAAEGEEIIAAARRAGLTLMIGHVERFNPAVQAIAEAIRDEDILSIAITRVGPFPPRMSNVGVVIDLAVH